MKKKIGIVTFHNAINFGAVLQCYALFKKLQLMGFDVKIIDYRNKSIEKEYSLFSFKLLNNLKETISNMLKQILFMPENYLKKRLFKKFIKNNCILTKKCIHKNLNNNNEFDILVTGSDQVWNKDITGGLDPVYMLDIGTNVDKISYAASIGKDDIPENDAKDIGNYIKTYKGISVREKKLESALKKAGNKNVVTVLDPVFLLSKTKWEELIKEPIVKEKYILVYMMEYNDNVRNIVDSISQRTGLKVVTFNRINRYNNILMNKYITGPEEFLNYIKNAELVITNSFHATAFSIILKKQFFTIKHSTKNSRIEEILTKTELLDRLLTTIDDINEERINDIIDYVNVEKSLNNEREKSLKFLENIKVDQIKEI